MFPNEEAFSRFQNTISVIVECQKKLFAINEDEVSFNEIWDLFENNLIINSMKHDSAVYYKFIMLLIMFAICYNPQKIVLYSIFVEEFLHEFMKKFMPSEIIKCFYNTPRILEIFLTKQIISIEDIASYLNPETVINNFSDEILANSNELIESSPSMKSRSNIEYIIRQINLKQNGKEPINQFYIEDYDDDSDLVKYITDDDINHFQSLIALENIDINKVLNFKYRCSLDFCQSLSLIEFAAKSNSIKIFKFLFIQPKIVISKKILIFAISGGSYDIIHICEDKLLDNSLDMNVLKEAIKTSQNEIFYYLIEKYEIELRIEFLYFCLDFCNLELFFELFPLMNIKDFIKESKNDFSLINRVCFHGFYYILEMLIQIKEFEIFLDKENSNFQAPIVVAAENFHIEIVRLLNETGKISSKSLQKATARAVISGSFKCVEYLSNFVNINDRINGNTTLLHLAIYNDRLDIIKLLLSKDGIDVNACSSSGFTPIHHAIILGNEKVVSLLLEMPDIDKSLSIQSHLNETPLVAAIKMNNLKIAEMIQNHIKKASK